MSLEEDILIERFLKKQLSPLEQEKIVQRIQEDAEFRERVNFEKQLLETLDENDWSAIENSTSPEVEEYQALFSDEKTTALRNTLKEVMETNKTQENSTHWFKYAIAASLALIISLSIFFSKESSEDLYVKYLDMEELPSLVEREHEDKLSKAYTYFENKSYNKAIPLFEKIVQESNEQKGTLLIYLGISYMESNEFNKAEAAFIELKESDLLDAPKANWFLALLALKQSNKEDAESLLKEIIAKNRYNSDKAVQLIEEL
ncbi:MAG: hypothetical protein HRT68_03630 [Flavobacteriaceae bacterium]|nr:hypothetical protein [Flavobacteriaceae bacterium]